MAQVILCVLSMVAAGAAWFAAARARGERPAYHQEQAAALRRLLAKLETDLALARTSEHNVLRRLVDRVAMLEELAADQRNAEHDLHIRLAALETPGTFEK